MVGGVVAVGGPDVPGPHLPIAGVVGGRGVVLGGHLADSVTGVGKVKERAPALLVDDLRQLVGGVVGVQRLCAVRIGLGHEVGVGVVREPGCVAQPVSDR